MVALTLETGAHLVIIFAIQTGHFESERQLCEELGQQSRSKSGVGCVSPLGNWVL